MREREEERERASERDREEEDRMVARKNLAEVTVE
jgi:hypothetical protein